MYLVEEVVYIECCCTIYTTHIELHRSILSTSTHSQEGFQPPHQLKKNGRTQLHMHLELSLFQEKKWHTIQAQFNCQTIYLIHWLKSSASDLLRHLRCSEDIRLFLNRLFLNRPLLTTRSFVGWNRTTGVSIFFQIQNLRMAGSLWSHVVLLSWELLS